MITKINFKSYGEGNKVSQAYYIGNSIRLLPFAKNVRYVGFYADYHGHGFGIDQHGPSYTNWNKSFKDCPKHLSIAIQLWSWVVSIIPNIKNLDARYAL